MSDLLNQASLVVIPSGYKEDTVYSVVPSDGSGDLSFTRASNGTRINSAGLVEVCPWNIVQQSETFDNAIWNTYSSSSITANDATAPNGTTTADKLNSATSIFSGIYQSLGTLPTNVYTYSIYVKAGTNNFFYMLGQGSSTQYAFFNLSTGAVGNTSGIDSASIESVGNGWYRCQIQKTGAGVEMFIGSSNIQNFTPTASGTVYLWGAQTNIGSTAKPYFPTTDRLNVPRLTYQNGGGGCPSLLLEKQSTNLLTYSEQIQNADWDVIGGDLVVTGNAVTSPDGTQNAGAITLANSANRYFVHAPISLTGGTVYTYSVWMKSSSGNLSINMGGVNGLTGQMKTVTTEWQRFTYTFTPASSYSEYFGFDQRGGGSSTSGTLYFWGAQVEPSSYPTSYIPTTSASATRVADACYKTGISSLIGGTSGTVFFDITTNPVLTSANYKQFFYYTDSSANQGYMYLNSGNGIITNPAFGNLSSSITLSANTRYKVALVYAPNDFALYVNGVSVATASSGTPWNFENLLSIGSYVGASEFNEFKFNQYLHFPTRLSNAELASLTTI